MISLHKYTLYNNTFYLSGGVATREFVAFGQCPMCHFPPQKSFPIREVGISFGHASVRGHSIKQAFSAAEVAREEYFFCGPSPRMFLFIPCLSRMTSEISHGSLLTVRYRTRLLRLFSSSH